ncbi:MAG: helix-turn-helix domain-containing protein [Vallitaleaceae bacterium]|nr:helix-turn-helix domain-containing protein [Vallitaleaceae bacterium]
MTINDRVKLVRNALKLTQKEFGQRVTLAQTYLSQIEKGDRDVTEKILKIICSEFNVQEEWLRNGVGEMFVENDSTIISSLSTQYNLDSIDVKIIESYLNLSSQQRSAVKEYVRSIADAILNENEIAAANENPSLKNDDPIQHEDDSIERELNAYRLELEAEKKGIISPALPKQKESLG